MIRTLQIAALAAGIFSTAVLLNAQSFSTNEVSIGIAQRTWNLEYNPNGQFVGDHHLGGPALSLGYTRNLSPSLAVEGEFRPTSQFFRANYAQEAGREALALGGVKAGWRGAHWGFYGKTQVGVESSSCGDWDFTQGVYVGCLRITNFALEYGGVVERSLAGRYSLRFDAARLLSMQFPKVLETSGNVLSVRSGGTLQHLDLRLSVVRSFGSAHDAYSEHIPTPAGWDVGAAFSLQPRGTSGNIPSFFQIFPSPSVWASWNFSRHLSWDSALIYSGPMRLNGNVFSDVQSGGRSLEPLTGLKIGIRRDHMGYFAKVHGGTITFGETETRLTELPNGHLVLSRGMFTNPVLDVGAIYEAYPSRRTILRFEAGSATVFYQPKTYFSTGEWISIPGQAQTGLLLSFGGGVRF